MKKEEERGIKRWLKRKVSINDALLVLFLITGGTSFSLSPETAFEHYYSEYNTSKWPAASRIIIVPYDAANGAGAVVRYTSGTELKDTDGTWRFLGIYSVSLGRVRAAGEEATAVGHETVARWKGNTALGAYAVSTGGMSTALGYQSVASMDYAIAAGYNSKALGTSSSSYGDRSLSSGTQSLALGASTVAKSDQSTAIGNDTYALGYASIALGTDDANTVNGYKDEITRYDYENYFKYLYGTAGENIDPTGVKYGFKDGAPDDITNIKGRQYSPTLSRGVGSIAVGSRSIAFGKGAISIGTLSFALKEGSTALGTKTRAEGIGAMALGNGSNVFSDFSVATGNQTQVLNQGGMAYGYQSYSAGEGSLALGREVSANAGLLNLADIQSAFEADVPDMTKLMEAGNKAKNIKTQEKNGVAGIVTQNSGKNYAIVVGNRAAATAENSLAFGRSAFSLSDNSAAIGSFSYADAVNAMAIGVGARVFDDKSKPGHTGISALAIGKDSMATLENSVAIGVGSRTDYSTEDLQKVGYAPVGALATPTTAKTGVISVGRKGAERRVANVASGYLNTDAANIGQLRALEETINLNIAEQTGGGVRYISTNKTAGDSAKLEGQLAIASDYKRYIEHVTLNTILSAKEKLNGETVDPATKKKISEEIGRLEILHKDFASLQEISSLNYESTGNPVEDAKKYSAVLQFIEEKKKEALAKAPAGSTIDNYHNADNSGAKGADSIAIGYDAETLATASNAVAIGKTARVMAEKGIALGNAAIVNTAAMSGVAIGENASVDRIDSVAIGKNSRTTGNNEAGHKMLERNEIANSTVSAYFGLKPNVFAPSFGEFAIGSGETGTRRLTGLAAGLADTDGVNVGQYKALANFKMRFKTDGRAFNRSLTSTELLEFIGKGDENTRDIETQVTPGTEQITFELKKERTITGGNKSSEKVATTKAVYDAIKGAKTGVSTGIDEILTVSGLKSDDISGNTFTLGINKEKLKEAVESEFAKKDASNIDKTTWVNKLGTGEDGLITKKEYNAATGIDSEAWKNALDVSGKWSITSGGVTSEINKANDTLTVAGIEGVTTSLTGRTLSIGVEKNGIVSTGDKGIVTGGTVRTAIDASKTTMAVNPTTEGALELTNAVGVNNAYTLSLNETKLKEKLGINTLGTDYAKVDASNIDANKENWVNKLSGDNGLTKTSDYKNAAGINADAWKTALGVSNIDLSYKGNGDTTAKKVTLATGLTIKGEKLNNTEVSGKNIWVESANDGVLTVKMSEKPNFTEVSAGTNKLDATGLTVGANKLTVADGITATKGTIGGVGLGGNQTTGLVAASTTGNAVEYTQFTTAINGKLASDAHFTVKDEAGADYQMNLSTSPEIIFKGKERDFVSPTGTTTKVKNITTKIDGSNVIIDLNDKVVLSGASIAGVTFTNTDGKKEIHAGDAKITNLADGEVAVGSRAAVNGGQLFDVRKIAVDGKNLATEAKTIAGTAKDTANTALTKANTNETNIEKNATAIAGHTTLLGEHSTTLGNHTTSINNITTEIQKGFRVTANDPVNDLKTVKRNLGDDFAVLGDEKNISTSIDDTARITVKLSESPTFGTVKINEAGSGKITGLSKGTTDVDAVNFSQLKPIATAINADLGADGTVTAPRYTIGATSHTTIQDAFNDINSKASGKITFVDGNSNEKEVALGERIQFKGEGANLKVALNPTNGIYNFSIINNPTFTGVVTANGFDANHQKISNVAPGSNPNDAVNYKQLQEIASGVSSAISLNLAAPVAYVAKVGGTEEIVVKAKKSGEADTESKFYKASDIGSDGVAKASAVAIGADAEKTIKISTIAKDGGIAAATKFTNVAAGDISKDSEDAINGSQLKPVLDALAMTWDSTTNNIKNPEWRIGNETFTSIPGVIEGLSTGKVGSLVLTNGAGDTVIRAKNNKFYKVSDMDLKTLMPKNDDPVEIGDIRYSTLNATADAGKGTTAPIQIGNVAEGKKENDVVTIKQLTKLGLDPNATDIKPVVTYDDNIKGTITLAGPAGTGTKITNLKKGKIEEDSSDAINGAQLYASNKAIASFIGPEAFDNSTGMIKEGIKFPSVGNNGEKNENSDLSTALNNLRYGFRIFGGKGPVDNVLDGTAGATNVGNKENLAILGDDNILTSVTRKDVSVTRIIKDPKTGEEKKETDTMSIPILSITMSKTPEFEKVTATESMSVGNSSNKDANKRAVLSINANGAGHITGLKNEDFNVPLKDLTNTTTNTLVVDSDGAATEGQLSKIVKDYIRRDDANVKYNDSKNKITLNDTATDGVVLSNVATAVDDKDAVNLGLLKDYSKERADLVAKVIGTTVDADGKIISPDFTKVGDTKPVSVKHALDLLGEKMTTGIDDLSGKIGDPGKDGADGRHEPNSPAGKDGLNGKDLNTKTNALRRGEAGIIVYTTETGLRVGKATDGKYYDLSKINDDGTLKPDATAIESEIRHSLVNARDGETTSATVLTNLGNGKVAKASKDAVTGDQLHKVATSLGTVTEDGNITLNKLKFRGNISTAAYDRTLGEEVRILGNTSVDTAEKLKNYTETNVATENTTDGIVVKFSKTPEFTSVKATDEVTVGTDGIKINGTEKTIIGLKNLTDASDDSSAVNKKFLDDKVKAISDKFVKSTGFIGNGADGRDGKDGIAGIAGTTGPTGKDGLNGKDLTSKINALRNGEAGTVVYTDDAGNRLYKGNDGKYYKKEDVNIETGVHNKEATAIDPTRLSLVNSNGLTDTATVLSNLANGKVAKDSKDAITGDQLHKFATNLGTVAEDGKLTLNKLKFRGNISTDAYDKTLGEEVRILGNASVDTVEKLSNYTESNVATENTAEGIVIKFSKTPKFSSMEATDAVIVGGKDGVKISGTEKTITGLKNLSDASDESSAVNKKFLDDKIKEISKKIGESAGGLTKIVGDGSDGKTGEAKAKGPTGKDGLNGKDLTSKINALRNGEAGTVVYTDKEGNRLYKGNDGNYYKKEDINIETGVHNEGAIAANPARLSLVNSNGETSGANDITLDNLSKGTITKESKEAITGSQLKDFADKVGIGVDETDSTKLADPKLLPFKDTFVKDGDGAIYKKVGNGSAAKYYKLNPNTGLFEYDSTDAIKEEKEVDAKLVDRINLLTALNNDLQVANKKGILFRGDNNDNTDNTAAKVSLGDTLLVNGGAKGDDRIIGTEKYIGGNIRVESSPTGMKIYTKANPEFDAVSLNKEALDKTSAVRLDQLNALRKELKLPPITANDPDGNGLVGDQRDPKGSYPDSSIPSPGGSGGIINNTVEALKNGEAGPIVYIADTGERLVLGEDSKYYKVEDVKDKVYHENKWYDAKKVKVLNGKLYDTKTGEEIKETALKEFVVSAPTDYEKQPSLSLVNDKGETTKAIKLKNVANGDVSKDSTDAVNGSQLQAVIETIKNAGEGQIFDGKDGKIGTVGDSAGSKGNTSKDSLNGKSTTDKANALRNGEAGTLVYTDAKGTRLFKGNDGKYYTFSDLESNGNVKKDAKAAEKVVATVVQYDGSTDKAGVVRVGDGEVSENSTEAVNGSQLHETNEKISKMASNTDARFETHEKAITENTKRIETLDTKVNKGLANAAAMSGLSFMEIGTNQATVAAAVGGYKGTQAVAVGVQMAPTENVRVNAKVSVTPGAKSEGMYSVGAAYRFNIR